MSIADIADKCGVSKMTVSRVMRNDPNVSEATRQLILRVAEQENYLPSGYGSTKVDGQAVHKQYYLLFQKEASLQDAFFSGIIRAIQQELFIQGRTCSLGIIEDDYSEFLKLYGMLQVGHVGGILIVGSVSMESVDSLVGGFGNVVLVDNPGDIAPSMPYSAVFCENTYGSLLAVRHLLGHKRRRILLVTGPEGHYFSRSLVDGYTRALDEAGVVYDHELVVRADFHVMGGYEAVKGTIEQNIPFDAVFANDEMACGAMRAISEAGLRIPVDISVVGFDNLPISEAVHPALTTVSVDREKIGSKAVELLLKAEQPELDDTVRERIGIFPTLLIRGSCGGDR